MAKTSIEWATDVWNPVTGCTKVSQGCKNCYAETIANRFWGERKFTDVQIHPERLEQPLRWKRPRRVFVNSMSDLFHESIFERGDESFVNEIFAIMAATPQHDYIVLTKRPAIMLNYLSNLRRDVYVEHSLETIYGKHGWCSQDFTWPLPNVWLGVSVENQAAADERIPLLLQTPAAVRFVSCEPLLGSVDLRFEKTIMAYGLVLNWVICGGESGPHARPMHPDWARSLRDQCQAAGVPFFFKQWGEWLPVSAQYGDDEDLMFKLDPFAHEICFGNRGTIYSEDLGTKREYWCGYQPDPDQNPWFLNRVGKKAAGRLLDGREWNEFPNEG